MAGINTDIVIRDFAYPSSHPLFLQSLKESQLRYEQASSFGEDNPPIYATDASLAPSSPSPQSQYNQEDAYGSASDEINARAVARYDFEPEHENEVQLREGQEVWISYRYGDGWLVAEDPVTGESGLVPEQYVQILERDVKTDAAAQAEGHGEARIQKEGSERQALGQGVQHQGEDEEDDWEDDS